MKSIRQLFKNRKELLDEPEVEALIKYCEELEDDKIESNLSNNNDKELAMLAILQDIVIACKTVENEQIEHERFGYPAPDLKLCIKNLQRYIFSSCSNSSINLKI